MDAYPDDYVGHNLPLILLSGLEPPASSTDGSCAQQGIGQYPLLRDKGPRIESDFPVLNDELAEGLRTVFLEEDASHAAWRAKLDAAGRSLSSSSSSVVPEFRIMSVGRSYQLPPRKADPPPISPPRSPTAGQSPKGLSAGPPVVLHSPISPLTPSSPTFPDGVLTPLWVIKHQQLVPAAVVSVFPFSMDPNMSSLRDNQLKIEINELKRQWSSTGYKTRFLVVLLAEEADEDNYFGDIDDRAAGIRRATNMDPKSVYLLPPGATTSDMKEFVRSLLGALHPSVVEYYRDLSKHARRKRNRSTIPPPTAPPTSGTSQTLSLQGWNVRYEFKLGIFAEFRQEMDAACRNYESAYETLFGQEVFEDIAGWSPRFNDARLLADSLAIRIIRCLLWTGQTAAAVRMWTGHRDRCHDIINRRGKGTRNYGWEAWEARWSMVMAQLIRRAEVPGLSLTGPQSSSASPLNPITIFAPIEKAMQTGDRIHPWEHLHHEGYWLYRSARHSMLRRALAQQIPEDDRIPPGESPASHIANKSYLYDMYLVPETHVEAPLPGRTGFDHSALIVSTLKQSRDEFAKRQQTRKCESIALEIAEEYMRSGSWSEAYDLLWPLWGTLSWRRTGWWDLMAKFGWALRECAARLSKTETIIGVEWELRHRVFPQRPGLELNLHKSLDGLSLERPKPSIVLRAEDVIGCLTASVVFQTAEGNVGEQVHAQLAISSHAQPNSGLINISEVKVVFEGCFRPIRLQATTTGDDDSDETRETSSACTITSVELKEPSSSDPSSLHSPTTGMATLVGNASLSIAPSQTRVYNLTCIPREAGEARVASITILIEDEKFDLAYAITEPSSSSSSSDDANYWWQHQERNEQQEQKQSSKGYRAVRKRRIGKDRDTGRCRILPKPPKIRITTPNLRATYYTNERVVLKIGVYNEEDDAADVDLEVRLLGGGALEGMSKILWVGGDDVGSEDEDPDPGAEGVERSRHTLKKNLGVMAPAAEKTLAVELTDTSDTTDYKLEISAVYNLVSDVQTPIVQTAIVNLSFVRPFEANYDFLPRLHPDPWPDFFHVKDEDLVLSDDDTEHRTPSGLRQRWCLNAKVVSFAVEPIIVEGMSLAVLGLGGGAVCEAGPEVVVNSTDNTGLLLPGELRESTFSLDLQKLSLGDRRPTSLNLALEVHWRRTDTSSSSSSSPNGDDGDGDGLSSTTTSILAVPRFLVPTGEPRVLASIPATTATTPSHSTLIPGFIRLDYTVENPSMHFLTFNLTMEASEQFAFSGPKTSVVQLVPLSRHTVRYHLLATAAKGGGGRWIQPQLSVVDVYFNKTLRVVPTEVMRSDKKGILIWVDAEN